MSFFKVALLERRRQLLTEHLDNLRAWFMEARHRRPFTVEAIVILPGSASGD
jgi:putative transposase